MPTTYDVSAFQQTSSGAYTQALVLGTNNGVLLSGIRKLAQRFILELMTEKNTMRYRNRGCVFAVDIRNGYIQTEMDVYSSFAISLLDVASNLTGEEVDTDPDDERYSSAEITATTISHGRLIVTMTVTSLTGESSNLTVPIIFAVTPGG